ncbi:MAG: hypothetical protein HY063_04885 [Bacteroidetes bacterium]|nr:hypothetical protein [Bacteroidota bacterium]
MEYELTKGFIKDARKYKHDHELSALLEARIKETAKAATLENLSGIVPIRGRDTHYRFKLKTRNATYRIGIKLLSNIIWFARLDKDKRRFYKRFK